MPCAGNSAETCGGSSALSLFYSASPAGAASASTASSASASPSPAAASVTLPSGWASSGCVAEGSSGRALTGTSTAADGMTVETCVAYCQTNGFSIAGLEYSRECYCGNSFSNGASLSTTSGNCNMPCGGNSKEICGGPSALSIYQGPASAAAATTSSSTAAASPTANYGNPTLPSGWSTAGSGCIQEVNGRALAGISESSASMTVPTCLNFCSSKGYKYAGLEYVSGSSLSYRNQNRR
jgi:hypothetical protein